MDARHKKPSKLFVWIAVIGGLMVVLFAIRATSTPDATDASQTATTAAVANADTTTQQAQPPPIDRHGERAPLQSYWNRLHGELGVANLAFLIGAAGIKNDDAITASNAFSKAASLAANALMDSGNNAPDGLDEVSQDLGTAANELKWASEDMVKYLDNPEPSVANDALEHEGNAKEALATATHLMRLKYVSLRSLARHRSLLASL